MIGKTVTRERLHHRNVAKLLEELLSGPVTLPHLEDVLGTKQQSLRRLFHVLRKQEVIHISGWEKDRAGRVMVAVYALGQGKDAARPVKPRAQIQRDYRARRAAAPLVGTPWHGLPVAANDSSRRSAA